MGLPTVDEIAETPVSWANGLSHMYFLNTGFQADPGMPPRSEVADECHWNLWRVRQQPFKELTDGSRIVLVHSWPGDGRLTWQVTARDVVTAAYTSKAEAQQLIGTALGISSRDLRQNEYTAQGPDKGFLLALRYGSPRRLNLPRPADMHFRPNGWLTVEDPAILKQWGLAGESAASTTQKQAAKGQGRLGPAESRAVEKHAMKLAEDWCRSNGWPLVKDVSSGSWDLEARKRPSGPPLFVEVKGLTGKLPVIEVTVAEVEHALKHPADTMLIVVTNITLHRGIAPTASGGDLHVWNPWSPIKTELRTTVYRWRPGADRLLSAAAGLS